MKRGVAIAVVACAGCGMGDLQSGDDANTNDAPTGCTVNLAFDPPMAIAGPTTEIRATASVTGAPGVLQYTWSVTHGGADVTYAYAQTDQSAVSFVAADPGPYAVMVAVAGSTAFCPTAQSAVNVGVENAAMTQIRLRVYPPPAIAAPPSERLVLVLGGAGFSVGNVAIDPGLEATGHVRMGTTGVPSYLRFIPLGARDAYVEGFTQPDGAFRVRMLNQPHDVLVVPVVPGYAPRLVAGWTPGTPLLSVDVGTTITGTVLDPAGTGIANAQVQLAFDGIPSTLATTGAGGAFSVRAHQPAGTVAVQVTPPMASGLPRIAGAAATLTAAGPFTIRYSPALVRRDLGGTVVRRNGVAQPGVPVKIVGTISAVASITAGATISANGETRIAATANGAGALPNGTLAPAAPSFAVSTISGQLAVDAIDLTTAVPTSIDAPAPVAIDTQLRDAAQVALPNAVLELAPSGALALAGAPTIRGTCGANGMLSLTVPAGGRFDVRASDPQGRAAPLVVADVPTSSLAASYALQPSLHVSGSLVLSGNPMPVGRATIQILCTACEGVERTRPLAEGASSSAGAFVLAVFDPGTN